MLHRKVRFYATYLIIIMKVRHNIIFSNHWLISGIVRTVCVCIFTVIGLSSASAQIYSTAQRGTPYNSYSNETYGSSYNSTTDMQQAQPTYNSYQSTVYQPFESSAPSDNNPVYSNSQGDNNGHDAPANRRNADSNLPGGGDPGTQGGYLCSPCCYQQVPDQKLQAPALSFLQNCPIPYLCRSASCIHQGKGSIQK